MAHAMMTTTTVRMAVARFELTPSIPILARIEVSAANTADNSANTIHIMITCNYFSCKCILFPIDDRIIEQGRGKVNLAQASVRMTMGKKIVVVTGIPCYHGENIQPPLGGIIKGMVRI